MRPLYTVAMQSNVKVIQVDDNGGAFYFKPTPASETLKILASNGEGWDHVSVSTRHRCPTWEEMEAVKRMFFHPHEEAMQLHVPEDQHINYHQYCLHIWRPQNREIPLPPSYLVGVKT